MERFYSGLDLGSKSFQLAVVDKDGRLVRENKGATNPANLIRALQELGGEVWVHLEASVLARWVRQVIAPHVSRVVVSHPKTNAWIAKDPLKRDELDAWKLAELLRMGRIHEVIYSPNPAMGIFKELVQHYDEVTEQQAVHKVKIKARLKAHGILEGGEWVYDANGRKQALGRIGDTAAREAVEQLYGILDNTVKMQKQARALVRRESHRFSEVARFEDQVPGVGLICAARFVAYIQTPHRFKSKRKLWRYCRLGITDRSSDGKPLGRKCLDMNGNGRLKQLSRTAFLAAMRCREDNRFKRSYQASLERTHNATHARLSTQRKILTTLWAMWREGSNYQDDKG